MLYYDRNDVFKGIDINKTNASKECNTCHHWHFLDKVFKFQTYICNGCHDVLMMSINLRDIRDIAILNINGVNYLCIITGISKSEGVNLLQKADLNKKGKTL